MLRVDTTSAASYVFFACDVCGRLGGLGFNEREAAIYWENAEYLDAEYFAGPQANKFIKEPA